MRLFFQLIATQRVALPANLALVAGMQTAYAIDSTSVLKVLDTGLYICLFLAPWFIAGAIVISTRVQHHEAGDSPSKAKHLDFGVLVVSGYQTILSQSTTPNSPITICHFYITNRVDVSKSLFQADNTIITVFPVVSSSWHFLWFVCS